MLEKVETKGTVHVLRSAEGSFVGAREEVQVEVKEDGKVISTLQTSREVSDLGALQALLGPGPEQVKGLEAKLAAAQAEASAAKATLAAVRKALEPAAPAAEPRVG